MPRVVTPDCDSVFLPELNITRDGASAVLRIGSTTLGIICISSYGSHIDPCDIFWTGEEVEESTNSPNLPLQHQTGSLRFMTLYLVI